MAIQPESSLAVWLAVVLLRAASGCTYVAPEILETIAPQRFPPFSQMLHTHEVGGSSPLVSTKKKALNLNGFEAFSYV